METILLMNLCNLMLMNACNKLNFKCISYIIFREYSVYALEDCQVITIKKNFFKEIMSNITYYHCYDLIV